MPSLSELQARFAAALRDDTAAAGFGDAILAAGIDAADRLAVYRNNWQVNATQALALAFPAIERLTGRAFFAPFVREFLGAHPSRSGDLRALGGPFPDFVARRFSGTPHEYLGDVAALEWAWQEALVAHDAAPLAADRIAAVPAGEVPALRFRAHPGTRLVSSPWPVFTIWRHNRFAEDDGALIQLDRGAEQVLIHRSGPGTMARLCEPADYRFLAALYAGRSLAEAYDRASATASTFDVGLALRQAVTDGVFCALEPDGTD